MKIKEIKTNNFMGLPDYCKTIKKPVDLSCGLNEKGKTTISNAIRFALTGVAGRADLIKKKDLPFLVTRGQKVGKVTLDVEHDGTSLQFERAVSTGICSQPNIDDHWLACCLDMHRFTALTQEERRKLLFDDKPDYEQVVFIAKKHYKIKQDLIDQYQSWIETGFEAALEKLRDDVRGLKGEWKGITGEVWGQDKGETWVPELPEKPRYVRNQEQAEKAVVLHKKELLALQCQINEARSAVSEANGRRQAVIDLEHNAHLTVDYKRLMEDLDREYEELDSKRRESGVLEGLTACPHCGKQVAVSRDGKKLVPVRSSTLIDKQIAAVEEKIKITSEEAKLAQQARLMLDDLRKTVANTNLEVKRIEELETAINGEKETLKEVERELQSIINYKTVMASKREMERRASAIHKQIISLISLGKALAGDGIPKILGVEKLETLNGLLREFAKQSGWRTARISDEADVHADEEPYFLLSESMQWRVDAMLSMALSMVSGWKLLILDRMDVLDLPGRAQALRWLQAAHKEMDTIFVMATLKEKPKIEKDWLQVEWLS